MDTPILSEGGGPAEADLIKNTTTKDFVRDVIDASRTVPVLVDFWAPWCGPCRQLTPILEKAVRAAKGAVKLVKLDIDEHPQIPGQMGVQSIPAVFAFQDGRPVDGFMGALPESRVKAFIARLIGDESADAAADPDHLDDRAQLAENWLLRTCAHRCLVSVLLSEPLRTARRLSPSRGSASYRSSSRSRFHANRAVPQSSQQSAAAANHR